MAKAGEMFSAQSRKVIIRLVLEYRLIPTSICHACCSGADHVPQANRLTVLVQSRDQSVGGTKLNRHWRIA
jgi:hypothetical protein